MYDLSHIHLQCTVRDYACNLTEVCCTVNQKINCSKENKINLPMFGCVIEILYILFLLVEGGVQGKG